MHALFTRLLLLPLLSPLLAVLLIAAVNPRPWVALRLLTWTSPAGPLGGWLATGLAVGAGISAAGTALALQGQPASVRPRRQVRRGVDGPGADDPEPRSRSRAGSPPPPPRSAPGAAPWAGPSRSASDPPPTVSVPFRVIRRPKAASATAAAATTTTSQASAAPQDDGWDSPDQDDW